MTFVQRKIVQSPGIQAGTVVSARELLQSASSEIIALFTKVDADAFSRIIFIIIIIIPNPTLPLCQRSAPQVRNGSARKIYRHDCRDVYFRVTLSFLRKSNFEFSLAQISTGVQHIGG